MLLMAGSFNRVPIAPLCDSFAPRGFFFAPISHSGEHDSPDGKKHHRFGIRFHVVWPPSDGGTLPEDCIMEKDVSRQGGDWDIRWGMLVADIWEDDALKKKFLSDPATVLKERGMPVPAGVQVKAIEDSAKVMNLVVPIKPAEAELSEEELQTVAGGHCGGGHGCGCGGHGCGCGHRCRCGGCGCGCRLCF